METIKVILTSLLSIISLFLVAKLIGHKQVSQLDFFDYINGITLGSIGAELATELDKPWKPLIAIMVYGFVSIALSFFAQKFQKSRKFINGTPTIVMDGGKLYRNNMKKAKLELSEFMVLCRQAGYFDLNDIEIATFEYNGRLSILPKSKKRPLTPEDINLTLEEAGIGTEIIMDGHILHENLKRLGLDLSWLTKQLKQQKYEDAKEIYLGIYNKNNQNNRKNQLTLFPMD